MVVLARKSPPRELTDLIDGIALSPEVRDLLGPGLSRVVDAAGKGDRTALHTAERAWASAAAATLDLDIAVTGIEHVDPGEAYIVAPLHEGFADVLAILRLPLNLDWVIRDELLDLPFFGPYLQAAGHIAVEPESARSAYRKIIQGAAAAVAAGESLVVFPQGSILGIEIGFQSGAFRLAERYGIPVLPVVLTGSHRVWEYPFSTTLRFGQRVRMEVMRPVKAGDAMASMRRLEAEMKLRALAIEDAPARRYDPERDGYWEGYTFRLDSALVPAATPPDRSEH